MSVSTRTAMAIIANDNGLNNITRSNAVAKASLRTGSSSYQVLTRNVGSWGSAISFSVSGDKQLTFRDMKKSVTSRWKDHAIIGQKPLSEFAGPENDSVTMTVVLSAAMGVNPRNVIDTLEAAMTSGAVDYLYVGGKKIGSDKMRLTDMSEAWDCVMLDGLLVKATLDLTFSEYVSTAYVYGNGGAGTNIPWEFAVGDKPKFTGGKVFKKCNKDKGKKRAAANVKVLEYRKGKKHPYKVKTVKKESKKWKGWVNNGTLQA